MTNLEYQNGSHRRLPLVDNCQTDPNAKPNAKPKTNLKNPNPNALKKKEKMLKIISCQFGSRKQVCSATEVKCKFS